MNPSRPTAKQRLLWAALIGSTVLVAAAFGYLVTTFLYAFSGGQYRMVTVVNIGALVVVALGLVVAALTWRLRSPAAAAAAQSAAAGIHGASGRG